MKKKALSVFLAWLLLWSTMGNVFAEEGFTLSENTELQTTQAEVTAAPTATPTPTPSPTPEPTAEPTAEPKTEPTATVEAAETSAPPTAEATTATPTDVASPSESPSESPAIEVTVTPTAIAFTPGLVSLGKGMSLFSDSKLEVATGMLTQDGVAYANPVPENPDIVWLTCTLDGEQLTSAYIALADVRLLTPEEVEVYTTQSDGLLFSGYPLFPLIVTPQTQLNAQPSAPVPFTEGLVTLTVGTMLYSDEACVNPIGTLRSEGVVYQLPTTMSDTAAQTTTDEVATGSTATPALSVATNLALQYTLDGTTLQNGFATASTAPQPLTGDALAAYLLRDSPVQVQGVPLFALDMELAQSYEMLTYGLPGMPAVCTMTADELAAKALLTEKDTLAYLQTATPNEDYVEGEVLLSADTEAYAQLVAQSYAATVQYYQPGFAILRLSGFTVLEVVTAAADPLARLVAVEPNNLTHLEPNQTNAGNTKKSTMMLAGALAVPTLKIWADFKDMDPFLNNPGNSSQYTTGVSLSSGYQYMHDMVGTYGAWGLTTGSSDVKVGILDSGFNASHTELSGQITNVPKVDGSSSLTDSNGHGTHVAGIIAAKLNNSAGGSGIAPGVSLLGYSVMDGNSIPDSAIIDGLDKMITNGAWVISMSLGGPAYSQVMDEHITACINAGIAVITAAGNDGGTTNTYPAAYAGVISVGAVDPVGQRAPYSNYGGSVTLAAPGSYILSTWTGSSGVYRSISGTSMATPVVAGVAALYYSARGTRDLNSDGAVNAADVAALRSALTGSCKAISGGMGAGIINATNLFKKVVTKPTLSLTVDSAAYTYLTAVPSNAVLHMTAGYNGTYMVYTIDGSTPTVRDGELINGTATEGDPGLSLSGFANGNVTVRAISVNAQGVTSGISTYAFTLDNKFQMPTSIGISGSAYLYPGKGATYKATFSPASSLKATWSVLSGDATVNASTGYVTLRSTASGTVSLQAAFASVTSTFTINVTSSLTRQLVPSATTLNLYVGSAAEHLTASALLKDNTSVDLRTNMSYAVTSSNAKVAAVQQDDTGWLVTPIAKGSASIRFAALDGSGVTKTVTVTVRQPATGIFIDGGSTACLAAGRSRILKAVIAPSNASSKAVSWELVSAPSKVTLSSTGTLTVPYSAGMLEATTATVRCTTLEWPYLSATQTITLYPTPVTSVTLTGSDAKLITTASGALLSAILFTVNTTNSAYGADNNEKQLQLGYVTTGPATDVPVLWTTSNTKIATVSQTGLVTAVGPGLVTITAAARDGSAKRASLSVRVRIPVANLRIFPSTARVTRSYPVLGFGYSSRMYAAFGNSYGTPSNTGLTWRFTAYASDGSTDITQYCKDYRMVSLSSTGVLTVRRDPDPYGYTTYYVTVRATTSDGTNLSNAVTYIAQPAITSMRRFAAATSAIISVQQYSDDAAAKFYFYTDNEFTDDFTITSSNPKVAAPYDQAGSQVLYQTAGTYIDTYGKVYYRMVIYIFGYSAGTATITVKTNDGSNKSLNFNVTVVNP